MVLNTTSSGRTTHDDESSPTSSSKEEDIAIAFPQTDSILVNTYWKGIPFSSVNSGSDFNNKGIAEPVLPDENRKYSEINHNCFVKVFMKESDIDIISINETKLDPTSNDNEVYIPGYEIIRKDRKIYG